jgi:hypothetical protein
MSSIIRVSVRFRARVGVVARSSESVSLSLVMLMTRHRDDKICTTGVSGHYHINETALHSILDEGTKYRKQNKRRRAKQSASSVVDT